MTRIKGRATASRLAAKGRATASRLAAKAESLIHTSVGQRPTFGRHNQVKAVSLAHCGCCLCARLTALITLFHANVGRCPTLVCARPLALG